MTERYINNFKSSLYEAVDNQITTTEIQLDMLSIDFPAELDGGDWRLRCGDEIMLVTAVDLQAANPVLTVDRAVEGAIAPHGVGTRIIHILTADSLGIIINEAIESYFPLEEDGDGIIDASEIGITPNNPPTATNLQDAIYQHYGSGDIANDGHDAKNIYFPDNWYPNLGIEGKGVIITHSQVLRDVIEDIDSHNHSEGADFGNSGYKIDSANVINTPTGNIAATNVQSAINELDTEKSDISHTHVDDDTHNHDLQYDAIGAATTAQSNAENYAEGYVDSLAPNYDPVGTAASLQPFISTIQTVTGSLQNIAHGLGSTPSNVVISMTDTNVGTGKFTIVEGTHDATNVKVTIANGTGMKFKVIAWP